MCCRPAARRDAASLRRGAGYGLAAGHSPPGTRASIPAALRDGGETCLLRSRARPPGSYRRTPATCRSVPRAGRSPPRHLAHPYARYSGTISGPGFAPARCTPTVPALADTPPVECFSRPAQRTNPILCPPAEDEEPPRPPWRWAPGYNTPPLHAADAPPLWIPAADNTHPSPRAPSLSCVR